MKKFATKNEEEFKELPDYQFLSDSMTRVPESSEQNGNEVLENLLSK